MMTLEITVLSAQGLNLINHISGPFSSLFSFSTPIRPFFTLTKLPRHHDNHPNNVNVYTSGLDHKFRVPLDSTFFSLHLQLYYKRRIVGGLSLLGWCLIPATDIGLLGPYARYLSYRLRARDGSRSPVIINLSIQFMSTSPTVVGIPIAGEGHTHNEIEGVLRSKAQVDE